MATVYAPPEGFEPPDFDDYIDVPGSFAIGGAYQNAIKEYEERLADEARKHHQGDLVGCVVRWPVADGYACYLVWNQKPLQLIHCPIGDAYRLQEFAERGIRISDIRSQVNFEKKWAALK